MTIRGDIETPLEAVEYLSRSTSRVRVLNSIHEGPKTRNDLKEVTDVSRVTLSRILSTFEDRGWVDRPNGEYETTPEGDFVAAELTQLLANVETLGKLDGAMEWLPVEHFDFDLSCLQDAQVTTSSWRDHTASVRRATDIVRNAETVLATASGVSRDVVTALWENTVEDDRTVVAVLDSIALDIVKSDRELRAQHREILASGNADVYRYTGPEEPLLMVSVCDDTVVLCGNQEDRPPSTLDTTDDTVHEWAVSYVERIRADATPLDADAFSE